MQPIYSMPYTFRFSRHADDSKAKGADPDAVEAETAVDQDTGDTLGQGRPQSCVAGSTARFRPHQVRGADC
jgi:hypothetical protein